LPELLAPGEWRLGQTPIYCRIVPDRASQEWLRATDGAWRPDLPIHDARGQHVASVWRDEHGSLFLPFDPAEAIRNYWSEAYHAIGQRKLVGHVRKLAVRWYYRVRPALPRSSQIQMRRLFTSLQARSRFPRWPIETALHDLYALLLGLAAGLARAPVPWLSFWPNGYGWALVLTHDVETSVGYANLSRLRNVEIQAGLHSAWNFVGKRYPVESDVVDDLTRAGCEVGVHGLYHDGRDLESLARLNERLPAIRACARRWHAVGFRSPATQRVWQWMPLLGFDYDSSYPDTDPFEPQPGGCCSWLPYFNDNLVELPITLPQDHTLFVILRQTDEAIWVRKAQHLKQAGGMALVLTHPDYMLEDRLLQAYARFLQRVRADATVWHALPREVSAWWRRRAASRLEWVGDRWTIKGPAATEGSVQFVHPRDAAAPVTLRSVLI
jgi:hypothetical protein